jgi:hypothetical protein
LARKSVPRTAHTEIVHRVNSPTTL